MFKQINFYSWYIIIQSISFTIIDLQHFLTITLFIIICNVLCWHLLKWKKINSLHTKNKTTNYYLLSFFTKCDFYLFLKRLFWKFHTLLSLSTLCLFFYFFICCCCIGCRICCCNWLLLCFWLLCWWFCLLNFLFFFARCCWFTQLLVYKFLLYLQQIIQIYILLLRCFKISFAIWNIYRFVQALVWHYDVFILFRILFKIWESWVIVNGVSISWLKFYSNFRFYWLNIFLFVWVIEKPWFQSECVRLVTAWCDLLKFKVTIFIILCNFKAVNEWWVVFLINSYALQFFIIRPLNRNTFFNYILWCYCWQHLKWVIRNIHTFSGVHIIRF